MTKAKGAKLAPTQELEEHMPEIACVGCGRQHSFRHLGGYEDKTSIVQGVLICDHPGKRGPYGPPCNARTVFEITGDSVSFLPGKLFEEGLAANVSNEVRELFNDGLRAFYGKSYRGTIALCRAALEQALDEKGASGHNLSEKINKCQGAILGVQETNQAHAMRLDANEALHALKNVNATYALGGLTTTVTLVNHIASKPPMSATQSRTGSNAP